MIINAKNKNVIAKQVKNLNRNHVRSSPQFDQLNKLL